MYVWQIITIPSHFKKEVQESPIGPNRELNPGPRTSLPPKEAGINPKRVSYY